MIILEPAVAMSAQPDIIVVIFLLVGTAIFLFSDYGLLNTCVTNREM